MVGIVCGVLLLIHLLVGLISHKLDHLESLRLSCVPLCGQKGHYQYRILIKTGWKRGSGEWNSHPLKLLMQLIKTENTK